MNNNYTLIEKSIKEKKLYDFFIGKFVKINSSYASIPIDDDFVFKSWLSYIKREDKKESWNTFKDILIRMSRDEIYSWFSIYYLYLFLFHIKDSEWNFFDIQDFINELIGNIIEYKKELMNNFDWVGNKSVSYSIWDDFLRMLDILRKEYIYDFHYEKIKK